MHGFQCTDMTKTRRDGMTVISAKARGILTRKKTRMFHLVFVSMLDFKFCSLIVFNGFIASSAAFFLQVVVITIVLWSGVEGGRQNGRAPG